MARWTIACTSGGAPASMLISTGARSRSRERADGGGNVAENSSVWQRVARRADA